MAATRILYHFPMSTFSRRARLALAHKGIDVELRDGRANDEYIAEAKRLSPLGTMPVLVDDGRVLGDSLAIAQYLDLAYPDRPRLFPAGAGAAHAAIAITASIDLAMNTVVDLGTRYFPLRNDPAWPEVVREKMARAQAAIDAVAAKATRALLAGDAWSVADIWTLSATRWVAEWPSRVSSAPLVRQMTTLGLRLPDALVAWAKQHEARPEVRAIYG